MEQKTACVLICDTRERHVTRHEHELRNTTCEIKQITTGDYVILTPTGNILAVIERKSLEDFGASIKDGRHQNKSKLNELRSQTGCRIIYIIEGPEFPGPDQYFANVPYRYIESSIFHLMIRDGVSVLRTRDSLHTARTLANFTASMDSLIRKLGEVETMHAPEPMPINALADPQAQPVPREAVVEMLTRKHDKTDHEIARELWSCFPGISVESADDYMRKYSIGDIVSGRIPRDEIVNFKMASGRAISKKVVTSLTGISKLIEVRLLSSIPTISHAMAVEITNASSLRQILTYSVGAISIIKVGKSKRNLGEPRAEKILRYLNYKYIPAVANPIVPDVDVNDPEVAALLDAI
jgi:ERCC4-type nuclease